LAVRALATARSVPLMTAATAQGRQPNIIVIMGDDIGWKNVRAYHQGLMYSTTPNLDKVAAEGMWSTDYYAEPRCTVGPEPGCQARFASAATDPGAGARRESLAFAVNTWAALSFGARAMQTERYGLEVTSFGERRSLSLVTYGPLAGVSLRF